MKNEKKPRKKIASEILKVYKNADISLYKIEHTGLALYIKNRHILE